MSYHVLGDNPLHFFPRVTSLSQILYVNFQGDRGLRWKPGGRSIGGTAPTNSNGADSGSPAGPRGRGTAAPAGAAPGDAASDGGAASEPHPQIRRVPVQPPVPVPPSNGVPKRRRDN